MGEKVHLKAALQLFGRNRVDGPLRRNPCVRNEAIESPEGANGVVDACAHLLFARDVHHLEGRADRRGHVAKRGLISVRQIERRPCRRERSRTGGANSAGSASDVNDPSLQWLGARFAQLGLFEGPVLHVEKIPCGQRLVAADDLRRLNDADRVLVDVGPDARGFLGGARRDETQPRHQDDTRVGV